MAQLNVCMSTASESDLQSRRLKLDYEEITPCLKDVTLVWERMLGTPGRAKVKFDTESIHMAVGQGTTTFCASTKTVEVCANSNDKLLLRTASSITRTTTVIIICQTSELLMCTCTCFRPDPFGTGQFISCHISFMMASPQ